MASRTVTICNMRGLHARAAAKFAKLAAGFDADVQVSKDGQTVTGTSIMGLMMLAASKGSDIDIEAQGAEAEVALEAIAALITNRFEEDE